METNGLGIKCSPCVSQEFSHPIAVGSYNVARCMLEFFILVWLDDKNDTVSVNVSIRRDLFA